MTQCIPAQNVALSSFEPRTVVTLDLVAGHEAGHAVMRWVRGMPLRGVTATQEGGLCEGTGRYVRDDDTLYVLLAGLAVESGYGLAVINWDGSQMDDIDHTRALLSERPWLHAGDDLNARLTSAFNWTCEQLYPHWDLIDRIADQLATEGHLSGRTVAAICREYGKRLCREGRQ